jgi:DNA polymerase-3 subunit alpha
MLFSVSDAGIRFGLLAVKNVGRQFLERILAERTYGKFTSFDDFVNRMSGGDLNRRMVESLIKAGTFDSLGIYRSRLLAVYESMLDCVSEKSRNQPAGQLDMFSIPGTEAAAPRAVYPELPDLGIREKLMMEKEATGMYFSGQMLDDYRRHVESLKPDAIADFVSEESDVADRTHAKIAGMITAVSQKNSKNGDRMAFFTLEDRTGEMEGIVFPKTYEQYGHLLLCDSAVLAEGTLSVREDEPPKLLVNALIPLIENDRYTEEKAETPVAQAAPSEKTASAPSKQTPQATPRRLYLRVPEMDSPIGRKAKNLAELFDGTFPTVFYDASRKEYQKEVLGVALSDYVLREFRSLLGEENVILK